MCARRFLMVDLLPHPARRRGSLRDLPVRRPGAARARPCPRAISRRRGGRRPGLCASGELDRAAGPARRSVALAARRVPAAHASATRRSSTSIRRPISSATAGTRRSTPGGDTEFRTRLFVQSQASAFNGAGSLGAALSPGGFGAFLLDSEDAEQALDLAYRDVAAAFDRVPRRSAGDRADHPRRAQPGRAAPRAAAAEKIAASRSRSGSSPPMSSAGRSAPTADLPALGLPAARRRTQTGCILSWMSFGEPANPDR